MENLIGKRLDGLYEVQELIGSGSTECAKALNRSTPSLAKN